MTQSAHDPRDVLMTGTVRMLGSNRKSTRRLSLFKKRTASQLTVTTDHILLGPSDSEQGRVIASPADIVSAQITNGMIWSLTLFNDSGKKSFQFQSESVPDAEQWVSILMGLRQPKPVIVAVGNSGVGKSLLCTALAGLPYTNALFRVGEDTTGAVTGSSTKKTVALTLPWFGEDTGDKFVAVDTPGLGDARGRDTQYLSDMVVTLRDVGGVNLIAVVLNSQTPRLDRPTKEMLRSMESMFGKSFWAHACLVFTHWDTSKKANRLRANGKLKTKDQMNGAWNRALKKGFASLGAELGPSGMLPSYFVDTEAALDVENEAYTADETAAAQEELNRFSVVCRAMPSLNVSKVVTPLQTHARDRQPSYGSEVRFADAVSSSAGGAEKQIADATGGDISNKNRSSWLSKRLSSRSSMRLADNGQQLLVFMQRLGLEHHVDTLLEEGIYTPEELDVIPIQYLEEIGMSRPEILLIKPSKGPKMWRAEEDTHGRLVGELKAAKIKITSHLKEAVDVPLSAVLKQDAKGLSKYVLRVKDRLRFVPWRQKLMSGCIISPGVPLWIGALVERGIDWSYDLADADSDPQDCGGPGRVLGWHTLDGSEVVESEGHATKYAGWIKVRWLVSNAVMTYRCGAGDKNDLVFLNKPHNFKVIDVLCTETLMPTNEDTGSGGLLSHLATSAQRTAVAAASALASTPARPAVAGVGGAPPVPARSATATNSNGEVPVALKHLRRSFGYPLGRRYPYWATFDIRDDICMRVGGFKHGQVVRFNQDGSKHVCIGVGVEDHHPQIYFHPKSQDFNGAGMFSNVGRDQFTVVGDEYVPEKGRDEMPHHFDDDIDNDTLQFVRDNMNCNFPYLCGTQLARAALFDTRDEIVSVFGNNLKTGEVLRNKDSDTKMWVVGVKNDEEGSPRLWFHVDGVEGAGISRMFNARMSEYERLPDKVDLQPCPMPVGISLTQVELEEIGRTLDCAFDFPRGTSTNTPMAKFDIRDEVCLKLCGYVSGTRFMGPYNGHVTVVGIALDSDGKTPKVWFHHESHLGAGQIPEFTAMQQHFRKEPERKDLTELKRDIDLLRGRQAANPGAMMLMQLFNQQFTAGTVGSQLRQGGGPPGTSAASAAAVAAATSAAGGASATSTPEEMEQGNAGVATAEAEVALFGTMMAGLDDDDDEDDDEDEDGLTGDEGDEL